MEWTMRVYQDEDDYWRIRAFLRDVFLLNGGRELSWQAYRFDHWRWHGAENLGHGRLEEDVFIWETAGGQIAAVLNPEGPGDVFLQVHPGLRTRELEEQMLEVAEKHPAFSSQTGGKLRTWCNEDDGLRHHVLTRRGYTKGDCPEVQRR